MIDLDALEAAAKEATPGPWRDAIGQVRADVERFSVKDVPICQTDWDGKRNSAFIATANPETILSLIARLRAAEEVVNAVRNCGGMEPELVREAERALDDALTTYDKVIKEAS